MVLLLKSKSINLVLIVLKKCIGLFKFSSTRTTIDLLDQKDNKEIWQESYYLHTKFFYGISRCVTINSPVKTLIKPNDFDVCTINLLKYRIRAYTTPAAYKKMRFLW